jgi:hypothetical protein
VPGVGTALQPLDRLGVVAHQHITTRAAAAALVVTVGAAAAAGTRTRTSTAAGIGTDAAVVDNGQMMSDDTRMGVKNNLSCGR